MDASRRIEAIRAEGKACAQSLLNAFDECDTPEEMDHLNAIVQAQKQMLNSIAYLIGLAIQERQNLKSGA